MGQREYDHIGVQGQERICGKVPCGVCSTGDNANAVLKQAADDFMREHPTPEEPVIEGETAGK